eukprot:SAG31_NODE_46059_length_256_cov_0.656051_1_plen_79_part_01
MLALRIGNTHKLIPAAAVPPTFGGASAHHCKIFVQEDDGGQASFDDCVLSVSFAFGDQEMRVASPPFETGALFAREVPI